MYPKETLTSLFLLDLTASVCTLFARIYYTRPFESDGQYWSLSDSSSSIKPAFGILADRTISYRPPAGSSCSLAKMDSSTA